MITYQKNGTTILLVTHDLVTLDNLCKKAAWLNEGQLMLKGTASEVIDAYREFE
jgi:ABC-type polysaccharide/polyol phosphate transport system ATPase subunit